MVDNYTVVLDTVNNIAFKTSFDKLIGSKLCPAISVYEGEDNGTNTVIMYNVKDGEDYLVVKTQRGKIYRLDIMEKDIIQINDKNKSLKVLRNLDNIHNLDEERLKPLKEFI